MARTKVIYAEDYSDAYTRTRRGSSRPLNIAEEPKPEPDKVLTADLLKKIKVMGVKPQESNAYNGEVLQFSWIRIDEEAKIDMHMKASYNQFKQYWQIDFSEFARGYQNGYTEASAKVRYLKEMELFVKMITVMYNN